MSTDPAGTPDRRAPSRHRPLVPVLAGLAGGIAADGALGPPLWFWLVPGVVLLPIILWGLRRRPADWGMWALALVLVAPAGGAYHAVRFRLKPSRHLQNLALTDDGLYAVRGRVTLEPRRHYRERPFGPGHGGGTGFWAFQVEVQALRGGRGRWRRTAGGLTVFLNEEPPLLHVGDAVQFPARISANRPPTNPGERNRALTYARHGSYGTAAVASGRLIEVRERAAWHSSLRAAVGRMRSTLRRRLERQLPEGESSRAGLIRALMFGEREALTPRQDRLLKETDTLHFLAISGLHVGMFCFFVTVLLVWTGVPVKARYAVTIVLVWLYVTFTGLHVSAVRAGLVLSFLLGAPLLRRPSDGLSALMGAAVVILLVSPQQLFSAGFQLTFVAVWAIVTIYPQVADVLWPWEDFLARAWSERERTIRADLWRGGRSYLLLSCIVWAVTAPIRLYHFNSISFVAPLLNLVVWPLVAVLLVVGFLLVGSLLLWGWAATPLLGMALLLTDDINWVVAHAGRLPGAGVYLPSPPLWWVGLCCVALGVWATRRRVWGGRRLFLFLVLVLGLTYIWQDAAARLGREFRMTVADVGHGQAVAVELPGGRVLVLDAGSTRSSASEAVAGVLWRGHVESVNVVTVSHMNIDHCSLLPDLARRFHIRQAALPKSPVASALREQVESFLAEQGVRVHRLGVGAMLEGGGLRCRVLHPDRRFAADPHLSENERSLVLRCVYGDLSFLLPGDVEAAALRRLTRDYGSALRSDLLIMPHHGRYHEGLAAFVDCVNPLAAVVSGVPDDCSERTAQLLRARDVPLWTTARDGAVIVGLRDGRATVTGHASRRHLVFDPSRR